MRLLVVKSGKLAVKMGGAFALDLIGQRFSVFERFVIPRQRQFLAAILCRSVGSYATC
jgi:hypothetical protein